jgi:predicted MFS family arabinose efflux permease
MALLGSAHALWVLFAARLLAGMAGANIGTAQAYMADVTQPEERARAMGRIGAALGIGFVLGPPFGGVLSRFGAGAPALVASGLSLVALVWTFVGLPESLSAENKRPPRRPFDGEQWRRALGRSTTAVPIALFFVVTLGFTGLEMAFSLFAKERLHMERLEIGLVFMRIGLVIALAQGVLLGPLQRRFGERRLAFTGTLLLAIGIAALPYASGRILLREIDIVVVAFGTAINTPSLTSLVSRGALGTEQGATLGVYQSLAALARATGPFCAGFVYDRLGHTAPFYAGAVIIAGGWIFLAFPLLRLGVPDAPVPAK